MNAKTDGGQRVTRAMPREIDAIRGHGADQSRRLCGLRTRQRELIESLRQVGEDLRQRSESIKAEIDAVRGQIDALMQEGKS